VKCWNCGEKGHVKSECPGPKKKDEKSVINVHSDEDSGDDALVYCVESTTLGSWISVRRFMPRTAGRRCGI